MSSSGILIIACGHPFYGRMAHNLAASIKSVQPDTAIALRWAGSALNHLTNYNLDMVFDSVEKIPDHCFTVDGKSNWIRTKIFMYDLSPFDETIFLDADTIWMPKKKPSALFNELNGVDITFANYGRNDIATIKPDLKIWANIAEVKQAYGFTSGNYYAITSEMVYFKRCGKNADFFHQAKAVYDNPKVATTVFAGVVPDEYAFSVAAVICGIEPHQSPYFPTYWHPVQKKTNRETLFDRHYVLSVGGAFQSDYFKRLYDQIAAIAFKKLSLETPYRYHNKRSWLQERKSI